VQNDLHLALLQRARIQGPSDGEQDAVIIGVGGAGDLITDPPLDSDDASDEFVQAVESHCAADHCGRVEAASRSCAGLMSRNPISLATT